MFSSDFRWRVVALAYVYGVAIPEVSLILGVSVRTLRRWYNSFEKSGNVLAKTRGRRTTYPGIVLSFKTFPCFYIDELHSALKTEFPELKHVSNATILRALHLDLRITRKVLERRAREALPIEVAVYKAKMKAFYSYPEQLVFVDETSKTGTDAVRNLDALLYSR
ncbi:hypothetical protein ATCC90586_005830 [Pythium insidiosum]|nr:hypothetical protein ATCC90586_005830 [Pythium insidiosum]